MAKTTRRTLEQRSLESPAVPISSENLLAFFGIERTNLPRVTIESALTVPAVACAVSFLSRTLSSLPLHVYKDDGEGGAARTKGRLADIVHSAPNETMGSFKMRRYFWDCVLTEGRGLIWIERGGKVDPEALWAFDPAATTITRNGTQVTYRYGGRDYDAADIIDVPFMLKRDQTNHRSPVRLAARPIQQALAMMQYGSQFFASGGVPPLALSGPLASTADALKRQIGDVARAIEVAKGSDKPYFPLPPGYELKPIGLDPEKGQMIEGQRFLIEEIARCWQLPPVFLQDLSHGKFDNVEQQDLHLVKHCIGQWTAALEDELNLKIFGRFNRRRWISHNVDGLQRGDFKSRIEGIARGIQTGQLTPNEARAIENRPKHSNPKADELLVQGATVVLGEKPDPKAVAADKAQEIENAPKD